MGFERFGELFRHGLVQASVKVKSNVKSKGFDDSKSLDSGVEDGRRVHPIGVLGCVHLDTFQTLSYACLAGICVS